MVSFEQYVRESTLLEEEIDIFLSAEEPSWARFDPDVGYTLGNYMPRDGIDGSLTISTSAPNGARSSTVYADRPCRINTYGNSFTQCHQVSDHETWQEYLAGHLGEPIRNFGMGGFGVYQAYRRMIRTEATEDEAEYIILYIWHDDHFRSLLRCRHVLCLNWHRAHRHSRGRMFHGNFWANLEMDLESGEFVERDNLLPTPESLYRMTDGDFMVEALRDDLMLQMSLFCRGETEDVDRQGLNRLADRLGCARVGEGPADQLKNDVDEIRKAYGFAASRTIVERAEDFATRNGKKLLIVLFGPGVARQLITTGEREDQPFVDTLRERETHCFDMNLVHLKDYGCFNLSYDDYAARYYVGRHGHYSPSGNHFFAFAIKDEIVDWLDPKPITYRDDDQARISFREGYLPES